MLIIGDVHGCYYTFKLMVESFWDKKNERLIQLGDLIDRGNYSPETFAYARELQNEHPDTVTFLKGNHEFEIIDHFKSGPNENWLRQCGRVTLEQYDVSDMSVMNDVEWFNDLPLSWENDRVFISHAGIAENALDPFDEESDEGVLWNRTKLKNIGKLQVIGHTPTAGGKPEYNESSNVWRSAWSIS